MNYPKNNRTCKKITNDKKYSQYRQLQSPKAKHPHFPFSRRKMAGKSNQSESAYLQVGVGSQDYFRSPV